MAYTTINKSSDFFNTKLYTGNGSAGNSITGVGFQSDWTWIKDRDNVRNHVLTDAVRGVTKNIFSNTDGTESTDTSTLTAFNSDGFTLGNGTKVNGNSINFASWNWKANGAGSANTNGGINSTVSVNTTSGFSIVKYTGNGSSGSTVGHGLGAVPQVIITKRLTSSDPWIVQHHQITTGNPWDDLYCVLNTTAARAGQLSVSGGYTPTSSLIYLGNDGAVNANGQNYITYCFTGKQGFSKFGSYTGNANADGTFVYTGFKPAWLLVKSTAANDWILQDTKRSPHNVSNVTLFPNGTDADQANTIYNQDILSNGFKARTTHARLNGSGVSYIYMAFAEAPLVGSNNVPCTAR